MSRRGSSWAEHRDYRVANMCARHVRTEGFCGLSCFFPSGLQLFEALKITLNRLGFRV